jgi:hypothetical protein
VEDVEIKTQSVLIENDIQSIQDTEEMEEISTEEHEIQPQPE